MQEGAGLQPTTLNVEDDLTLSALGLPHADCILVATQHDPYMGTTFSELGEWRSYNEVRSVNLIRFHCVIQGDDRYQPLCLTQAQTAS